MAKICKCATHKLPPGNAFLLSRQRARTASHHDHEMRESGGTQQHSRWRNKCTLVVACRLIVKTQSNTVIRSLLDATWKRHSSYQKLIIAFLHLSLFTTARQVFNVGFLQQKGLETRVLLHLIPGVIRFKQGLHSFMPLKFLWGFTKWFSIVLEIFKIDYVMTAEII